MRGLPATDSSIRSTARSATTAGRAFGSRRALIERYAADHAIDWACAVDRYEGRMKDIIHALKYERRRSIAPPLGALMRERGAELLRDADVVVPVPLHPRREYQRGFNQAEDLARQLGVPVLPLLKRVVSHAIADRAAEGSAAGEREEMLSRFTADPRLPESLDPVRLSCPGRRCLDDRRNTRSVRARVEERRCEGSAGAYSSPSRDRTALSTAAETVSLSCPPSMRDPGRRLLGLPQVTLAHAAEQRHVALELVASRLSCASARPPAECREQIVSDGCGRKRWISVSHSASTPCASP